MRARTLFGGPRRISTAGSPCESYQPTSSGDGGEGSVLRRKKRIGALQVTPVYQGASCSSS
jgi:hypothetical protein